MIQSSQAIAFNSAVATATQPRNELLAALQFEITSISHLRLILNSQRRSCSIIDAWWWRRNSGRIINYLIISDLQQQDSPEPLRHAGPPVFKTRTECQGGNDWCWKWNNQGRQWFPWQPTQTLPAKMTPNHRRRQTTHHRPRFVQKPNCLTLLTSIFFFFRQQFFLNSSSLSTNRKQTVYNRSNPYSTKHSQGKNEHFRFLESLLPSPPPPPLRGLGVCLNGAAAPLLSEGWSFSDGRGGGICAVSPRSDGQPAVDVTMVVQ